MSYIPKRVVYISGENSVIDGVWEETVRRYVNGRTVTPFTCCDVDKENTIETAVKCHNHPNYYNKTANVVIRKLELDNIPTTGYELHRVGHHTNRDYYNVICPGEYYYDIYLDELLDIMKHEGIVGGKIISPLVWVRDRATMKLTRVNSSTYLEAMKNGKDKVNVKSYMINGVLT